MLFHIELKKFLVLVVMSQVPHQDYFLAIVKQFECLPYCNYPTYNTQQAMALQSPQ
jgi:hypothetical protein